MRKTHLFLGAILFHSFSSATLAWAADTFCSASYITEKIRHDETVDTYGQNLQAVNVFAYEFDSNGHVVPKSSWVPEIAGRLRNDPKRLILVDIVNDIRGGPGVYRDYDPGEMIHVLLSDPTKRALHIRELVAITAEADGLEIDYEHLPEAVRPWYTVFLRELRAALPAGKRLAVVIQPKTDNAIGKFGRAIDWRAIEPYVDWIRLMAYYYSWGTSPPGPVISYDQLRKLALYSLNSPDQAIPRAKARMLLSLYGWDWPMQPLGKGRLVQYDEAMALANRYGVTPKRDPASDVLYFRYTADDGVVHEVWVDDATSIQKRIELLMTLNYPHIDLWHLGTGDTRLWEWTEAHLRRDCPDLQPPPVAQRTLSLEALSPSTAKVGSNSMVVTLTGVGFSTGSMVLWDAAPRIPVAASSTTIQLALDTTDLLRVSTHTVVVADAGSRSNALGFMVVGKPVLDGLTPNSVIAGSQDVTLRISGQGFEPNAVLRWNGANRVARYLNPTTLELDVPASDLAAAGTAVIAVFNPTAGELSNTLALPIRDSSDAESPFANAVVSPNPWAADQHNGHPIRFTRLVAGTTVRLFTLSARHVRTLNAASGVAEWDLKNEDGQPVASGYYLYILTAPSGQKTRGKLAIVR